ncbi:unnamed protein product [Phaedon cochleariae]|uniref:Serine/threonine-protein kinase receptor n=1 Tax=Phaedon cochleariae TaxID=80249 RepID=A0A9N9SJ32_PHACE|nr:unnamed protein product [Phaedon cochleariae]
MYLRRSIPFICLLLCGISCDPSENKILCWNNVGSVAHIAEDGGPEVLPSDPYQIVCKETNSYCFVLWTKDPMNDTIEIMSQGCWEQSGKPNECERSECIADKKPPKAQNQTKFCCCNESHCNLNFSDRYIPMEPTPAQDPPVETEPVGPFVYVSVGVVFLIFVVTVAMVLYWCWRMKPKKGDVESCQQTVSPPADYSLEKLKMIEVIGQGRYGSVWRGTVEDREVAVKVFPAHHRNVFLNEREAYEVAGEHRGLLECFGGGELVTPTGAVDYVLLLGLEQRSLQDHLKQHTVDLPTLAKMSLGVARGLAHLHSDVERPCVAHRDLNTRNVLVRADLSCCVCDLGLAVVPRRSENKAISEAGTLRYMAPEVLEGAVNLRDCESALKQIDIYALGLVLWELGSRCTDVQNAEPSPYAPPFSKEAGENPSLEQMQTLVSRKKARPLWPVSWKDTAAARLLCETAEDCWDQDAEARLTALCVAERLTELPSLKGRVLHPHRPPASPTLINNNHLHDVQFDASVNTIETLLSPSEENCKNSNQLAACVVPLQPHQGRNPCMERNLLSGSSDSLLIDKSSKHCGGSESQNLIPNDFLNFQVNHRATPIPYLQNAVHGIPKQQNTKAVTPSKSKFRWSGLKNFLNSKRHSGDSSNKNTRVKLDTKVVNGSGQTGVTTSLLRRDAAPVEPARPSTLPLETTHASGVAQIARKQNSLSRQKSLEQFNEVFSSTGDLSRLKPPAHRVKTPGDVPASVRRTRGKAAADSARFSLYDDRMMGGGRGRGEWGSAPDLEPPPAAAGRTSEEQDGDSVSSF